MINLGGLPGVTANVARSINATGEAVGASLIADVGPPYYAIEWSNGSVINLGDLTGSTASYANAINDPGQVVGYSFVNGGVYATEWSNGSVIYLDNPPGSNNGVANGINDAGQVVGYSEGPGGVGTYAIEWINGSLINLGALTSSTTSEAYGINSAGQVVGWSVLVLPPSIPEPSTWAMMLFGFAGLALASYRRAKAATQLSRARGDPRSRSSGSGDNGTASLTQIANENSSARGANRPAVRETQDDSHLQ